MCNPPSLTTPSLSLRRASPEQAGEQESHFSEKGVWLREKEALEHQLRQLGQPIRAQPAPPGSPQRTAKSPHKLNLHDPSDNLDTSMRKVGTGGRGGVGGRGILAAHN